MNIGGLEKALVLAALYNAAPPENRRGRVLTINSMSAEQAQAAIGKNGLRFGRLDGRALMIDLSSDEIETTHYNHYNGVNAAERAIEVLRRTGEVGGGEIQTIQIEGLEHFPGN